MEPDAPAPAPLPVAWLQGDVLAEYLAFLDELEEAAAPGRQGDVLAEYFRFLDLDDEAEPAPRPTRVPVAWLQGEVRDEFLRFLEESESSGGAAAVACPEEGEEERGRAPHGSDDDDVGFDGRGDGVVVDDDDDYESFADDDYDYESFVDDDEEDVDDDDVCVMEYRSEDGGVVFTMDTGEDDPVLELLRPHILALPAFRERAAGLVQPQHPMSFPRPQGGWMSSVSDDESPRQEGRMRSELLRRRIQDLRARYRACAAEVEALQQQLSLAFPRQDDGSMSSDDDDGEMAYDEFPRQDDGWLGSDDGDEMTDELPRQDDGWMSSDEEEDMTTDEFTGNRNPLQLRRTY